MSTSSTISNVTIHKVPNYSTWNTQYSGGGISSNDLVIIPPTSIQEKIGIQKRRSRLERCLSLLDNQNIQT